ncbi:uncharacterized protein TNCV_3146441, partial [Trichonephila clavipes]
MDWPARSPASNPIEYVWDFLGRRLAARTLPPVTIRELRLALQDEWAAMPQQLIDTPHCQSMGRRCETCPAVREIISPTKDRMFLADTHHRDVSAFSRIAPMLLFQSSFIPLISLTDVKFLIITWHLLVVVTASFDVGEIADNKSSTASSKNLISSSPQDSLLAQHDEEEKSGCREISLHRCGSSMVRVFRLLDFLPYKKSFEA